jgi:hypothetical protein
MDFCAVWSRIYGDGPPAVSSGFVPKKEKGWNIMNGLQRRWKWGGIVLAASVILAAALPGDARAQGDGLVPAQLRNATYTLEGLGPVTLADGQYHHQYGASASEADTVGLLATAAGDLNGDGAGDAAVVVWHNGGGSGTFVYLAAMLNQDGEPAQAALTLLGDRVYVYGVAVDGGRIAVDAVTHAESDPLCCPSLGMSQTYSLEGGMLLLASETRLGSMVSTPDGVSFVLPDGLAGGVTSTQVPAAPEAPAHMRVEFVNGGQDLPPLRVFSTTQFSEYPLADGQSYATRQVALRGLLEGRPGLAGQAELPFLPEGNGIQVAHGQEAYIGFAGGAGIRYVAVYAPEDGSTEPEILYTFQGLTDDNRYYVSAAFPLEGGSQGDLNALPEGAFSPALDTLDTLFETLFVSPVAIP